MELEVAIFTFGALLLLVALLGRVEIRDINLGTGNRSVRISAGCAGAILILGSTVVHFWPSEDNRHLPPPNRPSSTELFVGEYLLVVNSTSSEQESVSLTKRLMSNGYLAASYLTSAGRYAVAVVCESKESAQKTKEELLAKGLAKTDAFISIGKGITKRIFPKTNDDRSGVR